MEGVPQNLTAESQARLEALGQLSLEPRPYFSARVVANLQGRGEERRRSWFWKLSTAVAPLIVAAFFLVGQEGPSGLIAQVGQTYSLQVSLEAVDTSRVAVARIELPPGVEFHSPKYPALGEMRFFEMPGDTIASLGSVPLVIKGTRTGTKSIIVRFLDGERQTLFEKEILIHFNESA